MPTRENLIGLSRQQLQTRLLELGVARQQTNLRIKQLWDWIYRHGETEISRMHTLGKPLQEKLKGRFYLSRPEIVSELVSIDGTRKWLLRLPGQEPGASVEVETVFIPEPNRGTLCVSSQAGCSLNCTFCYTGTQAMMKNLAAAEILGQVLTAQDRLNQSVPSDRAPCSSPITNIVMMGMGEPLLNFENVKQALQIALDDDALGFSRRRITLSTSGVVPGIERTGRELKIALAVSLHAVRDELRDVLVPINRKYPIQVLLDACRKYPGLSNARRIIFEYVMLKDVNDSMIDARELVRLLDGIPAKINLIPFNPWPGSDYECSSRETLRRFSRYLLSHGYSTPIRATRGQDIMAACGQLKA